MVSFCSIAEATRALASAQMYIPLLTSNLIYIGAGKLVTEMRDLGTHVHIK